MGTGSFFLPGPLSLAIGGVQSGESLHGQDGFFALGPIQVAFNPDRQKYFSISANQTQYQSLFEELSGAITVVLPIAILFKVSTLTKTQSRVCQDDP